ncbi:hypothetical protein LK520_07780 [Blautia sp. DFI.4.84]|nr:hypothetical protein [Blautia sp. DFI.4.84]
MVLLIGMEVKNPGCAFIFHQPQYPMEER